MAADAHALLRLHVEALYTHDARGRIVRVNEPGGAAAPRFFLGRSPHGIEWRARDDVDDDLARELSAACAGEPLGERALRTLEDPATYERLLGRAAPVGQREEGPAFCFPDDPPTAAAAAREPGVVAVTAENADLLRPLYSTSWENAAARAVAAKLGLTPYATDFHIS